MSNGMLCYLYKMDYLWEKYSQKYEKESPQKKFYWAKNNLLESKIFSFIIQKRTRSE